ncbi:hypothetical protein [Adhaeribacter radiodurans]|uniref:Uncharacterized protein n=1 Tax=Adhaeribacter radiodurans TaxID=2745197 RepID=A0A7L7LDM8_9BACT|nr:hypothetical protein [Adhaeribacter radiodurans]QMU30857.1 hypothetical protein HUW48_23755 [Adhaeribacter radiodurans]
MKSSVKVGSEALPTAGSWIAPSMPPFMLMPSFVSSQTTCEEILPASLNI